MSAVAGTLPFALPGEDDYLSAMEGACAQWRAESVTRTDFKSFDGVKLRAYYAVPKDAKACIVMVHGYCEFFGKYHEMAWCFYRAGYAVFFPEQRGFGHSGGKLSEPDVVYIDRFDTYVKDLHVFLTEIVQQEAGADMPRILFAHSMGGAVAALYLENHPDMFRAALLSSPMFRLKSMHYSPPVLAAAIFFAKLLKKEKTLAPGQTRFDALPAFEESSALSKARYDYIFAQRMADRAYQTYASSLGWGLAAMDAMRRLLRDAAKITVPVTVFAAGNDALVSDEGYRAFHEQLPGARFLRYKGSKHEIYNADDTIRKRYYMDVFRELERVVSRESA